MATTRDYYEVLEVTRSASQAEIKRAFRKLAMKYHPDRNPTDAGADARFKELNEAYEVLSDPNKRDQYDRFGRVGGAGGVYMTPSRGPVSAISSTCSSVARGPAPARAAHDAVVTSVTSCSWSSKRPFSAPKGRSRFPAPMFARRAQAVAPNPGPAPRAALTAADRGRSDGWRSQCSARW